ncbi:MAG TPA: LuxR C-terminal-related transcriptional regulator [Anaerolineae bacterium]|nr:LuxR C-terminal-related transcriptional regulator [Anaerolineae bacterium]
MTASPATQHLVRTKLHRPQASPGLELRARLLEPLNQNIDRALSLISAPAGFGKTTLASMWLQTSGRASAWVSLDERDDDLLVFTGYLIAAIQGVFPTLPFKTQALLRAPLPPSASTAARYLINDLHQIPERFILALDDIHAIRQPAIFDLLAELLRYPLPSLHLALIGRRDPPLPIASLRARGQVTEIRARDLCLTTEETAHLLGQMLRRDIDHATAVEWTEKTEGWVTALRLAALSLHHGGQADQLKPENLAADQYIQDYLLADVLAHIPVDKREWLLKASLLDRFCPALCEAACGPEAGASLTGKEFVRWLAADNLFLVALDAQGQWHRFHRLFQSLLQVQLQELLAPGEVASVRRRASAWCTQHGLWDEAIHYALASGDTAAAARVMVRHRNELMNTDQWRRLDRWLKLLPADVVAQSPLLLNTQAFRALQRGEEKELMASQQQTVQLLAVMPAEAEEREAAEAELGVLLGAQDFVLGQSTRAIAHARSSLEYLPPRALHIRTVALATLVASLQMEGNTDEGVRVIREALDESAWSAEQRVRLWHYLCTVYMMDGDLHGVLDAGRECLRIAERWQHPAPLWYGRYNLGTACYLRNELGQAEPPLRALFEDRDLTPPVYLAFGAFALALIAQSQGHESAAVHLIEAVSAYLQEMEHRVAYAIAEAFKVELALRQGKLAQARRLSRGVQFDVRPPRWYFYVPQLTQCKLLLAEGTAERLAGARSRLEVLDAAMRGLNRTHVRIDVLALLALVYDALGQEPAALDTLGAALDLAEPGGFVRNFVDLGPPMAGLLARLRSRQPVSRAAGSLPYLEQILAAFPAPASAATVSGGAAYREWMVEPLTEREGEVLRALATDLSPEQIAGRLLISLPTMRTHIRNIYAKLGVHSRFEAIQRARELRVL